MCTVCKLFGKSLVFFSPIFSNYVEIMFQMSRFRFWLKIVVGEMVLCIVQGSLHSRWTHVHVAIVLNSLPLSSGQITTMTMLKFPAYTSVLVKAHFDFA